METRGRPGGDPGETRRRPGGDPGETRGRPGGKWVPRGPFRDPRNVYWPSAAACALRAKCLKVGRRVPSQPEMPFSGPEMGPTGKETGADWSVSGAQQMYFGRIVVPR